MNRRDEGREKFIETEPLRRWQAVVRARETESDAHACEDIFAKPPDERGRAMAEHRAGWQFDAQERVLLAVEEWGGQHGAFFPGGVALTKLIADFRAGKI